MFIKQGSSYFKPNLFFLMSTEVENLYVVPAIYLLACFVCLK